MPRVKLVITLAILSRSLGLLTTLDAGAFVALALADLGENARLGTAALETLQSAIQRFTVSDSDFSHSIFPPSEYAQGVLDKGTANHMTWS